MNVLVTGGAGFIGSHLVYKLLKNGDKVVVLDKFHRISTQLFSAHYHNKNLKLRRVDITDDSQIKLSYFKDIDWVFHLAALSTVFSTNKSFLDYHRVNVNGTVNVLELSRRNGIKKFVYAASASCYGSAGVYPTPEKAKIRPGDAYGFTKYIGELYSLHWWQVYKLPVISLRLFNVYGPKEHFYTTYGPVLSAFVSQKLAGVPYTVAGDGRQSRDFVFVSDVVDAFIRAAKSPVAGEVFNVGSGKTHSIKRVVALLGGRVIHEPMLSGQPDRSQADISKIKKLLGWHPKVAFADGIKIVHKNIEYWKMHSP